MKPIPLIFIACVAFTALYMVEAQTIARAQAPAPAPAPAAGSPAPAPGTPPAPGAPAPDASADSKSAAAERSHRMQKEVGQHFKSAGWFEKLRQGGPAALVQILVSVFGAAFMLERFVNLRRSHIAPKGVANEARELWRKGNFEAVEKLEEKYPSTLTRAISWVARHRHAPFGDISAAVGDLISQEIEENHQRAYPLGVVATLEPLIGLLGMILGMITTFETVALAGALGDPAQLAEGISEALVTTGLGLAIAIPFLAMFHYFKTVTNSYGSVLEREMTGLLSEWFLSREAFLKAREEALASTVEDTETVGVSRAH